MGETGLWTGTVQSGQEPSSSTENKMQGSSFCPFSHCIPSTKRARHMAATLHHVSE